MLLDLTIVKKLKPLVDWSSLIADNKNKNIFLKIILPFYLGSWITVLQENKHKPYNCNRKLFFLLASSTNWSEIKHRPPKMAEGPF